MIADVKSKTDRYWINADGSVNFYKLSRIDSVQEGETLAKLIKPDLWPGRMHGYR